MLFFKDIIIPAIKNATRIHLLEFVTLITFSVIGPMLMEVFLLFIFNMYRCLILFPSKINGVLMCELHDFLCSPRVHLQWPWLLRKSKLFVFLYRLNTVSFRNYLVQDESGQGSETFVWVNNKSGLVFSSR